jgi:hypothetical protein
VIPFEIEEALPQVRQNSISQALLETPTPGLVTDNSSFSLLSDLCEAAGIP